MEKGEIKRKKNDDKDDIRSLDGLKTEVNPCKN